MNLAFSSGTPQFREQRGATILIFIAIVLLGVTTLLVTELSVNQRLQQRTDVTLETLNLAKQALIGYGMEHNTPGTLPCPDTTGDGQENPQGANCQSQLGLVPHRTLNLPELLDGTGARIWYAVDLNYTNNAAATKNSSINTNLTLDGVDAAAILIGPGPATGDQARRLLNQTDYLEGQNADGNLTSYESTQTESQNDQVIALYTNSYWTLIETRVLSTAATLVTNYRTVCGEYPWAASFGGPFTSTINTQLGALPLNSALPNEWGSACGLGTAPTPPAWLQGWADQVQYRMCTGAEGTCISFLGEVSVGSAALVTPGVPLAVQARPDNNLSDYFELENDSLPDNQFRIRPLRNHDSTYNDSTRALNP